MDVSEVVSDQFVDGGNPGVGKAIVIGAALGIVLAFFGVGGLCLAAGYEWTTALGLAVFASIWSGFGFGFMFGGIIYVTRLEKLQDAERKHRRVASSDEETPVDKPRSGSTTLA